MIIFNNKKPEDAFTVSASRQGRETMLNFSLEEKIQKTGIAKLFSPTGSLVREISVNGGVTRLKLTGLQPGLYYCLVFLGHRVLSSTLIVPPMIDFGEEMVRFTEVL